MIGMLREGPAPHAPTPALRDIPQLVEQSRCAGSAVQLRMHVDEPDTAPGSLGRAAYRIVQEALTNVHKHAAGSPATVSLRGGPGEGLQVDVRNPLPRGRHRTARGGQRARRARRAGGAGRGHPVPRPERRGAVRGGRAAAVGAVSTPVRVLLVDDDALVRSGLRMILSSASDVEVVGEAGGGAAALDATLAHRPDVVLMDIRMPDVDGIIATGRLRALPRPPQVIVLTTFHLDDYVFGALRAGASGFLLKDTSPVEIVQAVHLVAAGEAMLSPAVTRRLIEHYGEGSVGARRAAAATAVQRLTERERDVAVEVGRGRSNAEIATALHLSEATVKGYVSRLLTALDVANRVQVAIVAHDAGLV